MPELVRRRSARILAAVALVGLVLTLTACVSDSAGSAFGAQATPTTPAAPTVAPTPSLPAINRNQAAALVDGKPIPGGAYANLVNQERVASTYELQSQQIQSLPTEQQLRDFALGALVSQRIESLYAAAHGISVTSTEVQSRFSSAEQQSGGPYTFTLTLALFGYTPESFLTALRANLLTQKVEQRIAPLPVSIDEVQARHILVKTKALADSLYAQLHKNPGKFAALAKKYSTDTGSAKNGGELGLLAPGATVPPFNHAAFTQPIGVIGQPVHSQFGYHIIQVEAHRRVPFAQLDQQTQQSYQTRQQTAYASWQAKERAHYHVKILAKGVTITP